MLYTAHCRALMLARITAYLHELMQTGNYHQQMAGEFMLADSEWFRTLHSKEKVDDINNLLNQMKEEEFYYRHQVVLACSEESKIHYKAWADMAEKIVELMTLCMKGIIR